MRGKVSDGGTGALAGGITPAYAGKSSRYRLISMSSRDHPRLCGEKLRIDSYNRDEIGSPPPMRGKDDLKAVDTTIRRITPAYAGKRMNPRKMRFAE